MGESADPGKKSAGAGNPKRVRYRQKCGYKKDNNSTFSLINVDNNIIKTATTSNEISKIRKLFSEEDNTGKDNTNKPSDDDNAGKDNTNKPSNDNTEKDNTNKPSNDNEGKDNINEPNSDNTKKDNNGNSNNDTTKDNNENYNIKDTTIKDGMLPKTGTSSIFIIVAISTFTLIAIVSFIKLKQYDIR